MTVYYTPFFHAKDGEFTALLHSTEEQRAVTLPLFEIDPFTEKQRQLNRFKDEGMPMCAYLDYLVDRICASFPSGHIMADTFAWDLEIRTETGETPIAFIINALLERDRQIMPVVGLDRWDSPDYQMALKTLDADNLPLWCIRLDSSDIEDAADPDHFLDRIQDVLLGLGLAYKQTGILLDFGDTTGKSVEILEEQATRVLNLLGPSGYRFFSMAGCSMPPSINLAVKKQNSQSIVSRKEMHAWRLVREANPTLPIAYGDYGVRGPTSSDAQNPNINGKIRYSIQNAFFVARGQSVKIDDGEQMYRLAKLVADSPHYQGPNFSWGDAELYRRAVREKKVGPGNSNNWIMFDTNHHLAWVVMEVAEVEHSLGAATIEV